MELTQNYIDSLAPNASAASNGKSLAKGSFTRLNISKEDDLLFGLCSGSGKNPYSCSVDFIDATKPVTRCSCPSRQIPCKHALGLMYAYVGGAEFTVGEIPDDIQDKRNKLEKRQEAKARTKDENAPVEAKPPSKAQISGAIKKMEAQLEGIALADKLLLSIVQTGLAGIDAKTAASYKEQIKQLGNYYINGIQAAFNELFILLEEEKGKEYVKSISRTQYIKALLKRSAEYLNGKKNVETEIVMDTESAIEEQIGHAWKLEELKRYDKCKKNEELLQLAFYSYGDDSRKEFVDEGYFISLNGGEIYTAKNYRPYKALKYVKEADSVFNVIKTDELMVYPGGMNPRIRWDAHTFRESAETDYKHVLSFANPVYADVIKAVKNQIKNPLADENPLALLLVNDVEILKKGDNELFVIRDANGAAQILSDAGYVDVKTVNLLKSYASALKNTGLFVMFHNDIDTGRLYAKPLSVVTEKSITRLAY